VKRYLFVISRSPYRSSHAMEQLEAAMVAAVFDGQVSILFRDEGVWNLQENQSGEAIQQRTLSKVLAALPSYEIDALYACQDSLVTRQVRMDKTLTVKTLSLAEQSELIAASNAVVTGQP
jgi:tRNA 2-thiouridine synthesizing protein C